MDARVKFPTDVYHFRSGQEMLNIINGNIEPCGDGLYSSTGTDLYSPSLGIYVFSYNCRGAIAYYYVSKERAVRLEREARKYDVHWGACLGPGGYICDAPEDEPLEGCSNLDFCNKYYTYDWIETSSLLEEEIDMKKPIDYVRRIRREAEYYCGYLEKIGNECAYTDAMIEEIIKMAVKLAQSTGNAHLLAADEEVS